MSDKPQASTQRPLTRKERRALERAQEAQGFASLPGTSATPSAVTQPSTGGSTLGSSSGSTEDASFSEHARAGQTSLQEEAQHLGTAQPAHQEDTALAGEPGTSEPGTSETEPPSPTLTRRRILTVGAGALTLGVLGGGLYLSFRHLRSNATATATTAVTDYSGEEGTEVIVTIAEGSTAEEIAQILVDAQVVASTQAFVAAYQANASAESIDEGSYRLLTHMSAANAVAALLDSTSRVEHTLTIPQGATRDQVRERLVTVGGFTAAEVDAAFADTAAIGLPEVAGGSVEGWLAPSTYDISGAATVTDMVATMVATTMSRLNNAGVAEADYESVLTQASIVEKEISSSDYYGQLARVIMNRLEDLGGATGGYLEMNSTVLYGLGRTGGIPTDAEIADSSNVYNTYQHTGLPPTPIGNPAAETISAVVNAPAGDWLYFVTVDLSTGETLFATTQEEQATNTELLTAYCEANPSICSGS